MKEQPTMEQVVQGLETTLGELGPALLGQVDGLTQKQLKRALKAVVNYIYRKEDDTQVSGISDREKRFLGGMFALVETGVQYSLHILSQLEKERQLSQKGESNDKTEDNIETLPEGRKE